MGGGATKSIAEHAVLTFSRAGLGAWDLPYFGPTETEFSGVGMSHRTIGI